MRYSLLFIIILVLSNTFTFGQGNPFGSRRLAALPQQPAPSSSSAIPSVPMTPDVKDATSSVPSKNNAAPSALAVSAEPSHEETTKPLTEKEEGEIQRYYGWFSSLSSPDDMFKYIRRTYMRRDYKATELVLPTKKSRYTRSDDQSRNTLCQWNYIIDRLENVVMRPFPTDGTTLYQQRFRTVDGEIELEFAKEADGNWHFAPSTIEQTPTLYRRVLGSPPIRYGFFVKWLPDWSFHIVGGLSYFQWTMLAIGLFAGWIVYRFVRILCHAITWCWVYARYRRGVTKEMKDVWKPFAAIVAAYVWYYAVHDVILNPELNDIAYYCCTIFAICMGIFVALRFVDMIAEQLRLKYRGSNAHIDNIVVPLVTRCIKIIAFCIGILALANVFDWPLVGIISGMGIGGIAVAFAAKETLGDLFGSVTVLVDEPFKVGDWILTGNIEGTVENVGMRSTRIRTFYNSLVTIPNNQLTTAVIDNMGQRRYRRFRTFISVCYDTPPDKIEQFCEGIRELIRLHPNMRKDGFMVELNEMRASSLDILMNVFFICPDTAAEYKARSQLLRDILKLAKAINVQLAFPTQTLHLFSDQNADESTSEESSSKSLLQVGRDIAAQICAEERQENMKRSARVQSDP